MSAMGPDGCHAVRVRGEWQGFEGVTRLMVSHKSSGRVSRACPWSPMVSEHAGRVSRGLVSWSVTSSDHERQGLRGCHALGSWSPNISDHERNGAGRVSRASGPW